MSKDARTEKDALGDVRVPADVPWGAATQRAIENFPVSARRFPPVFIRALALIKRAAAETNAELGRLDPAIADAIAHAAQAIAAGGHAETFPLDIFQTGSGTSTNMNANEVIATLANERLGHKCGDPNAIHPNDHVNRGQSSNDVMPSALHLAAALEVRDRLLPALQLLAARLGEKGQDFDDIVKIGRTHLMDAMPVRLGQEFSGWARQVEGAVEALAALLPTMGKIALGATAVGTGAGNTTAFAPAVAGRLTQETGLAITPARNGFAALSSRGPAVLFSGTLKTAAVALLRIAEDIRLLASGPRLGLGEITLPALQPGSSMMPGKVNPVIPEMVCQVAHQVIANDLAVTLGACGGHLELNTQLPLIASNLLESITILANAARLFAERCVAGIEANEERCRRDVAQSLALTTPLAAKVGYARAAAIAHEAERSGRTIRAVALEQEVASAEELDRLLDARALTGPEDSGG